jgi:hypothetical protein
MSPGPPPTTSRTSGGWLKALYGICENLQLKDRFKKSLSMSGEVGSLAGNRVVSHERSRPADLPHGPWSRHAGPYPSHYCGCVSWRALLARGHRGGEAVTARNVNSIDAFEGGQSTAPATSSFSGMIRISQCGRSRLQKRPFAGESSVQRHDQIRWNTTLRLFAGISVITGAENPTDCATAATASRSRRPSSGCDREGSGRMLVGGPLRTLRVCMDHRGRTATPREYRGGPLDQSQRRLPR